MTDADTYAVNDESENPFTVAMRNERKSVVSGKSNVAAEEAAESFSSRYSRSRAL